MEEKKGIKKEVLIVFGVIAALYLMTFFITRMDKDTEPTIVLVPEELKDMTDHCRYNLWHNDSGFSLIFSLNSSDCNAERITNRCKLVGGVLAVHEDFLEDYPNATASFSATRSGEPVNLNHVQCSIYLD